MKWIALTAMLVAAQATWAAEAPGNFIVHNTAKPLPEILFEDEEGHASKLADYHGKIVLINVWATWCVPCRKEMPTLDRLQAELGGPDFQVVALSIDRGGVDVVRKFYENTGIQRLKILLDHAGAAFDKLAVIGLPTTVLIDRDGREIGRLVGPTDWDTPEMTAFLKSVVAPSAAPAADQEDKRP
jgi:thiol-disulfide isomerase/thioredoxin